MLESVIDARSAVRLALLAAVLPVALQAQSPWTEERVGSLFPSPPQDAATPWLDAGPVSVRTLDAAFADWAASGAIAGTDVQPPVRIRAEREYRTAKGTVAVAIDSEDLETAGIILAANGYMVGSDGALLPGNDEVMSIRAQFLQQGLEPLTLPSGHLGFVVPAVPDGGSVLAVRSGTSGTVSMECAYAGCASDLRELLRVVRFEDIDAFTAFDHRRRPEGA